MWTFGAPDTHELRVKKAALHEVIELQRAFIESRESAADGTEDEAEELRWYTEQAARLDKFKAALNALRLQSDEFPMLVPQTWAQRSQQSDSRELVPYLLRINARSQLTFVPTPLGGCSARGSLACDADLAEDIGGAGSGGAPRVFFMDRLRHVKLVQSSGELAQSQPPPTPQRPPPGAPSAAGLPPPSPPPPRTLSIELTGEALLPCVTAEASEVAEVLGAHLKRYNSSRVAQASTEPPRHTQTTARRARPLCRTPMP